MARRAMIRIGKGDDMSEGDGFETRMGRRAGSKSSVGVGVERHDESI